MAVFSCDRGETVKKSFLIVISLIMACLTVLTACKDTSSLKSQDLDESSSASQAESCTEENTLSSSESEVTAEKETESELEKETTEAELESDTEADSERDTEADSERDTEADSERDTENNDSDGAAEGEEEKPSVLVDNIPASKSYKGILHYKTTDGKDKSCNISFIMDYKALIDGNNELYSKDLSKLSVLFASDVYKDLYVEFTEGASGGNDDPTTFASALGLQDVKSYDISADDYNVDKDDVTQFVICHKSLIYNGKVHEVIIASVRGTNETNAEWSSNFDVGADTEEYYGIMGSEHPHWKNKDNHKGFDVAANRVYDKLAAYIGQYVDSSAQKSILITGHSRGAAIANILGKIFSDDVSYKTYAYTFAAPNTTTVNNAGDYKNIFNIINDDDIITYLPLSEWGFTKYGVVKSISVEENYEDSALLGDAEGTFEWFIGSDYNTNEKKDDALGSFKLLVDSREELYRLDSTADGKFYYAGNFGLGYSEADADTKYNELIAALESEKLLKFCNVRIVEGGTVWKYRVEINYCPAYLMQILSNMTTGEGPLLGQDLSGKYNDAKMSFVAASGKVFIGGMEHPHMQPTYYLIAENDFLRLG